MVGGYNACTRLEVADPDDGRGSKCCSVKGSVEWAGSVTLSGIGSGGAALAAIDRASSITSLFAFVFIFFPLFFDPAKDDK
jgi:hypothetical protein